jgi:hypothetical protein
MPARVWPSDVPPGTAGTTTHDAAQLGLTESNAGLTAAALQTARAERSQNYGEQHQSSAPGSDGAHYSLTKRLSTRNLKKGKQPLWNLEDFSSALAVAIFIHVIHVNIDTSWQCCTGMVLGPLPPYPYIPTRIHVRPQL